MAILNEMQEKLQISDENAWQYCYYFYNYHLYSTVLVRQKYIESSLFLKLDYCYCIFSTSLAIL